MAASSNTSLKQNLSSEINSNNNLRNVSFSSYLSNAEETFVDELAESNKKLIGQALEGIHFSSSGRKKVAEDGEIGVFSAEKYFNGVIDEDSPRITKIIPRKYQQPKKEEISNDHIVPAKPAVNIQPATPKVNIQPATPSVVSESSRHSQTALLHNFVQRKTSSRKANKSGRNFLAGLGCKCYCSDKDSIDVDDEHVGEISFKKSPNPAALFQGKSVITKPVIKTSLDELDQTSLSDEIHSKNGIKKDTCFSFPTSTTSNNSFSSVRFQIQEKQVLKPRKSLEVFGSPVNDDKRSKSFRIERRLSMLSWDTTKNPKMEEIDYSATSGGGIYNDNESDASSDLFEIESLSGKVTPYLARQKSDVTSGCVTPTTCYAPSEASIEWSVVTASAADFSAMSDYEEFRPPPGPLSPIKTFAINNNLNTRFLSSKEIIPTCRPGIFLGCNSHKAVRVAGDGYTPNDKTNFDPRVMHSYMPVAKCPAETKLLMGFDHRQRQHGFTSSHSLPRSHPSQSSHLLYIQ
ncbi:hypothetical protein JCGZ_15597 [Jatropha curcas]|uniref:Protein PHYTOCHROME KINASE SUBSTRATE 1 n=2 Tax=Jatropha curcas TaxID=180498 RepID=A0A067L9M2_JATCU|nr:hypothetical protein JCGZ_15597 [Jatropha curcas]